MAEMNLHKPVYPVLEPDYYEASIVSIEEVDNRYYSPNDPDPAKRGMPKQFKIRFEIQMKDGERPFGIYGWVNPVLSPKSQLNKLCAAVIEGFDPKTAKLDTQDLLGKKLRLSLGVKDRPDGTKTNIIESYASTKKA